MTAAASTTTSAPMIAALQHLRLALLAGVEPGPPFRQLRLVQRDEVQRDGEART